MNDSSRIRIPARALSVLAILVIALCACATSAEERAVTTLREAILVAQEGDLDRAAELLERAHSERPGFVDPLMLLGNLEERREDYEAARGAYTRVLGIDPTLTAAAVALAMTYAKERRFDETEQWLRRALEEDPGYEPAVFNLGWLAQTRGHFDEAAEWYGLAATLNDRDPTPLFALARMHLANGQTRAALEAAESALARKPDSPELQALRDQAAAAAGTP